MDLFRRKKTEELLQSLAKLRRGKLKIFIGAVSGTGKTYQLLQEAQELKQQNIDVVWAALGRSIEGVALPLQQLEQIAGKEWIDEVQGQQYDLDIAALLHRHPEVVLVDGLAHANQPNEKFAERWEDVLYLLEQGISVITTVNIYELDAVAELAVSWINIVPTAIVPTAILELADDIQLLDGSAETILLRWKENSQQTSREWLEHKKIEKLRELALRLVAEDVNDSLEKFRKQQGLSSVRGISEHILVAVQYYWNSSIHIRRGQQMARRLGGDLSVVHFAVANRKLLKEALAFKKSTLALVQKLEATFEEVVVASPRRLAEEFVQYAQARHITRIVIGHSKRSSWKEKITGTLATRLMKRMTGSDIDLYIVADRSEAGERILPTRRQPVKAQSFRRLSELEVKKEALKLHKGRLKIYVGAAPGVGKTFAMLREGNRLLQQGIQVAIGLLETHGRKETYDQIEKLTIIPRRKEQYHGIQLEELDVAAIIANNPEVVLIDELAHANMPFSHHKKRYEDILQLIDAGISVITTINIQHIESLHDAVERLTGVDVRETVPDYILQLADEIELIDIPPKKLQERMRNGKIYEQHKVEQALYHFFRLENLIALRELALREVADDVDERLEGWERTEATAAEWKGEETIVVGVTMSAEAEWLIRRGFRIAHRLKADWFVVYMNDGNRRKQTTQVEQTKRCEQLAAMTKRLGGHFVVVNMKLQKEKVLLLLEKANEVTATQMIIGQMNSALLRPLLQHARHMDILVVAQSNYRLC
ncbi:histidine kinase [Paenibacillus yanchengensis]|uniref:Histidine kinase n=1 Tax=Paenibacillus yanchengensis TaxID=2035833 RepID=A0ABW4YG03_9BACL